MNEPYTQWVGKWVAGKGRTHYVVAQIGDLIFYACARHGHDRDVIEGDTMRCRTCQRLNEKYYTVKP